MKNLRIAVRIEENDRKKIEQIIRKRKFKNISQVIRQALKEFLEE